MMSPLSSRFGKWPMSVSTSPHPTRRPFRTFKLRVLLQSWGVTERAKTTNRQGVCSAVLAVAVFTHKGNHLSGLLFSKVSAPCLSLPPFVPQSRPLQT